MELVEKFLSIVILNWNQPQITVDCINSILAQQGEINFDIVIVDNGSTDDSVKILNLKYPQVKIIQNKKNLGFQGGMNVGIRDALRHGYQYVFLLNNDTVAEPDMLNILFDQMPADAHLVSPGIYYYSKPDLCWSLGGKINPILLENLKYYENGIMPPNENVIEYDFIPSTAWLVKTSVFKNVGLIDEKFFPIYYDDLDFCLRLRKKGYRLFMLPKAKLLHKVSLSVGGKNSPKERYLMARNSGYYFRKHMKLWQMPFIVIYRFGSAIKWTFRLCRQSNLKALGSYWKGLLDGWFGRYPT